MILLALAGVSFSACSDDNTAEDYRNHMTDIFQDLKDNYTGYITMPDNSSRTLKRHYRRRNGRRGGHNEA